VNATIKVPQIRAIQRIHFVARSPTSLTFGMIYPPCFLIRRITMKLTRWAGLQRASLCKAASTTTPP
jgi:hypothetical protein